MEATGNKGSPVELHARRNQPRLSVLIPSSCIKSAKCYESGNPYESLEPPPGQIPPFDTKHITETAQIGEGSSILGLRDDQNPSREHSTLKSRQTTSDIEAENETREHSLEEDADSEIPSSDQNVSSDHRHLSSTQNHSPHAREWPDIHECRQNIVDHGLLSVLRPYPNAQPRNPRPREADSSSSEPSNRELIGHWDESEQITELESLLRWRPSRGNRPLGLDPEEDIWDTWWDDDGEESDSEAGEATEDEDKDEGEKNESDESSLSSSSSEGDE